MPVVSVVRCWGRKWLHVSAFQRWCTRFLIVGRSRPRRPRFITCYYCTLIPYLVWNYGSSYLPEHPFPSASWVHRLAPSLSLPGHVKYAYCTPLDSALLSSTLLFRLLLPLHASLVPASITGARIRHHCPHPSRVPACVIGARIRYGCPHPSPVHASVTGARIHNRWSHPSSVPASILDFRPPCTMPMPMAYSILLVSDVRPIHDMGPMRDGRGKASVWKGPLLCGVPLESDTDR